MRHNTFAHGIPDLLRGLVGAAGLLPDATLRNGLILDLPPWHGTCFS